MSTWISMIFGCQYSVIHTRVDIHDIQAGISMQRHSAVDIRKYTWINIDILWISVFTYPSFFEYQFGYPWISMDIHDLLWLLDREIFSIKSSQKGIIIRKEIISVLSDSRPGR